MIDCLKNMGILLSSLSLVVLLAAICVRGKTALRCVTAAGIGYLTILIIDVLVVPSMFSLSIRPEMLVV